MHNFLRLNTAADRELIAYLPKWSNRTMKASNTFYHAIKSSLEFDWCIYSSRSENGLGFYFDLSALP